MVALLSLQWEEIYFFPNDGQGGFTTRRIWGSTNEDYGSSGISMSDLNQDGRPDIIYSNGDGFGPTPPPGLDLGMECSGSRTPATADSVTIALATGPAPTVPSGSILITMVPWTWSLPPPILTGTTKTAKSSRLFGSATMAGRTSPLTSSLAPPRISSHLIPARSIPVDSPHS
ncbi:MAG: VCBS repeat-containing protein [Candidatus Synoicihabitans palmerolidicus]|nr:VCBS repeat-containing protein [Candidatus Synoicihabitans palmerolidicus]